MRVYTANGLAIIIIILASFIQPAESKNLETHDSKVSGFVAGLPENLARLRNLKDCCVYWAGRAKFNVSKKPESMLALRDKYVSAATAVNAWVSAVLAETHTKPPRETSGVPLLGRDAAVQCEQFLVFAKSTKLYKKVGLDHTEAVKALTEPLFHLVEAAFTSGTAITISALEDNSVRHELEQVRFPEWTTIQPVSAENLAYDATLLRDLMAVNDAEHSLDPMEHTANTNSSIPSWIVTTVADDQIRLAGVGIEKVKVGGSILIFRPYKDVLDVQTGEVRTLLREIGLAKVTSVEPGKAVAVLTAGSKAKAGDYVGRFPTLKQEVSPGPKRRNPSVE